MRLFAENPLFFQRLAEWPRRFVEFDANPQSQAAHFRHVRTAERLQTVEEVEHPILRSVRSSSRLTSTQSRARNGTRQRIASESGTVVAGLEYAQNFLRREHGRDRIEASGERLANDHRVGTNAFVHEGEQFSGTPEARLNFVGDQQHAVFAAYLGGLFQEACGRNDDSGFALDWLDQEGAGVGRDGVAQGLGIAEWNHFEARRERAETVAILLVGREADDGDGAPVEIIGADDDLCLALGDAFDLVAPLARRLHGSLDRLGARVHGQRHVVAGELVQFLVKQGELVVAEGARGQRDFAGLLDQRREDSGWQCPWLTAE